MNGSDILHLMGVVTGIETIINNETGKIDFYPNPMKDYARMQFDLPESGETLITLYDISGREIAQNRDFLSKGNHTYGIRGIEEGIYFIRIGSGRYSCSGRLISSGSKNRNVKIVYENTIAVQEKQSDSKGTNGETVMQYTTNDLLKLTGISGNYSTVITDVPSTNKTITFNFIACNDGDGNYYPVVKIGTQTWMAENLKTTKYNDEISIPIVTETIYWMGRSLPAFCWYNNDTLKCKTIFGALYNWYTVNTGKLCPSNWHIPSYTEWMLLVNFVGGSDVAGGKLKATGTFEDGNGLWYSPNKGATNESGFSALPAGTRATYFTDQCSGFCEVWEKSSWWCSGKTISDWGYSVILVNYSSSAIFSSDDYLYAGLSVRCIKDN
jgi:uncharacterized protein (TIGR02145 family)